MRLGVIGGLGPMATAYFMELITKMTDAQNDQGHIEMIVYSSPSIPDRTKFIVGQASESPLDPMINIGRSLVKQGVDCISIPCITAHYFIDDLSKSIEVPIINGIGETVSQLKRNNIEKVGIMATAGTIKSKLFQQSLAEEEIEYILPSSASMRDIMDIIYNNIKAGYPPNIEKFHTIAQELRNNGAEAIVLGCTELSLIKKEFPIGTGYIDVLEVIAAASITYCERRLKDEYRWFITEQG